MKKLQIKHSKIFNQIEKVRSNNNKNWMDLLRLAYKYNPKETYYIISKILKKDQKLVALAKKLKN